MFSGSSFPMGLMRILCNQTGSGKIQEGGLKNLNACICACTLDINAIPAATPMVLGPAFQLDWGGYRAPKPEVEKMATSELQISIYTVLLVYQNFSYHMGVITRKQVEQSRICGTFCARHFRFG